jgi:P4 family phage/plasmid primase-like protien
VETTLGTDSAAVPTPAAAVDGDTLANGGTDPSELERVANFLRATRAGVVRTAANQGDGAKRVIASWPKTAAPIPSESGAALGFVTETLRSRNLAVVARPENPDCASFVIIDVDSAEALAEWETFSPPPSVTVHTPGGGFHVYYEPPASTDGICVFEFSRGGGIIAKANGYVVAPGSRHPNGGTYTFTPERNRLAAMPDELYRALLTAAGRAVRVGLERVARAQDEGLKIMAGERETTLFAFAASLRGRGEYPLPTSAVIAAVQDLARNHCEGDPAVLERWATEELPAKVERWCRGWDQPEFDEFSFPDVELPPEAAGITQPKLKEDAMADHFLRLYPERYRYFLEARQWIDYDEAAGRWRQIGANQRIRKATKHYLRGLWQTYGEPIPDDLDEKDPRAQYREALRKFHSRQSIRGWRDNMLNHLEEETFILGRELDRNPDILAVGNGVLDLLTLEFRDGRPSDYITLGSAVNYTPGARSDDLDFFLRTAIPDSELRAYLQRFAGLCLTGLTIEERFWIFYNLGRGGKGTFLGLLEKVLGEELAIEINFATLATSKYTDGSSPSSDVARMRGKRLVVASEKNAERLLDEERIKRLTGGDPITARFLNENEMQFDPTFKLVLQANQKPRLTSLDDAIRSRIVLVPWTQTFTRKNGNLDITLKHRLHTEPTNREAGLAWMVEGLREYRAHGLGSCRAIDEATAEYLAEMNPLTDFVERYFDRVDGHETKGRPIELQYMDYLRETEDKRLSPSDFATALKALGFTYRRDRTGSTWIGLRPKGAIQRDT